MTTKMTTPQLLVVLWLVLVLGVAANGPRPSFVNRINPLEFSGSEYYINGGGGNGGGSSPAMLEDLRRGQEGLIVKLNDVTKSLQEDELKLNNVFYKLGRHDTDLEGFTTKIGRLYTDTRRIESKLNKHAFNVDFLRRRLEAMQQDVEAEDQMSVQVATVRSIVNRLDDRLTDALARLGLVENTTKTLEKRSAPHYEDLYSSYLAAAARPPTLTVYPTPRQGSCKEDWEHLGLGCYRFGGEEWTFTEAVAACVRHGGHLVTLPSPDRQLDLILSRLHTDTVYWTSGTDAFNRGTWAFLMTAQPVMPLHWSTSTNTSSHHSQRCAALSADGLVTRKCTSRLPYICHTL